MNGQIDAPLEQGIIDLLGEEGSASELTQRGFRGQISGGLDLDPLGFVATGSEEGANPFRLP
jgi:hypothetical protein